MLLIISLVILFAWCVLVSVAIALCVTASRADAQSAADLTLDQIARAGGADRARRAPAGAL